MADAMQARRMASVELTMTDAEYASFAAFIERHLGIRLPPEKRPLVLRRLREPVIRSGHDSYRSWAEEHLKGRLDPALLAELADALTTNHTYFWREPSHFEHFRDLALPDRMRVRANDRDLRVWCAAAATGEEPYQLAMILRDVTNGGSWTAGLLATDVSARALDIARAGTYPADRLQGLPAAWRDRYVRLAPDGSGTMIPQLKADITFRRLNLLRDSWPFRAPFDVVFCRNVLIYFDPPIRDKVVTGIVGLIAPGGYLYVGHAESLPNGQWPLEPLGPGIWRKRR